MNSWRTPVVLALSLMTVAESGFALNRCVDAQGKVSYSDLPCPSNAQGGSITVKPASGEAAAVRRNAVGDMPASVRRAGASQPDTVSGQRARIAAVEEAMRDVERKMNADRDATVTQIDKLYRELGDRNRIADLTPEAAQASQAVTFSHIQNLQRAAGERMRAYQEQLRQLQDEKRRLEAR